MHSNRHTKVLFREHLGVWGGHGIGSALWTQGSFSLQVAAMPTTYFSGSLVNPRVSKNDPRTGLLTGHRCTGSQRLTAPWVDTAVICSEDSLSREKEAFTPRLWGRSHAALATSNPQGPVNQALPVICPLHPSSVIPTRLSRHLLERRLPQSSRRGQEKMRRLRSQAQGCPTEPLAQSGASAGFGPKSGGSHFCPGAPFPA